MLYYLILAHNNLEQLELLIKKIKTENSEIYVHVDKKISDFKKNKNVHYIENRQTINRWGTSMIKAELLWFSEIYKNMKKWDHIILMSWQCYPIKNMEYIENYIQKLWNQSCMSYDKAGKFVWRLNRYYFYDLRIRVPKKLDDLIFSFASLFTTIWSPHRVPVVNIVLWMIVSFILPKRKYLTTRYKIYKWSQWMVLSYKHIKWILEFLETEEWKKYSSSFEYTSCSDEMFFQIMMLNDEGIKTEIDNELLRYFIREDNANSPNILTMKDLDSIKKSDKLFARKFDIDIDSKILEEIDNI